MAKAARDDELTLVRSRMSASAGVTASRADRTKGDTALAAYPSAIPAMACRFAACESQRIGRRRR
eukprot:6593892-Prymnesium_polylepis.2